METTGRNEAGAVQWFWKLKSFVEKVPGAFRVYKLITSQTGEGKLYTIKRGPMAGVRWRRYNRLPYWYHLGLYEPQQSNYIQTHLREGETFWDIGAHAGYHAICAARVVGPRGRVIAVEPTPAIARIMREQIALNHLRNITVLEQAVSESEGEVTFMQSPRDSRSSAIAGLGIDGEAIQVPCTTLDHLLEHYPAPAMLKMDIEGAEIFALPGGRRLFSGSKRPKHLLIGVHGDEARRYTEDFFARHDYQLVNVPGFDDDVTLVGVRED